MPAAVVHRGRFRVTVEIPTSLADGSEDAADVFERLWSQLPEFGDGNNAFCFLDDAGGVFLKGQRFRAGSPAQAGRLVREVCWLGRMRAAGVPVPELILDGVERRFGVPVRSLLVLRRIRDARHLRRILLTTGPAEREHLWEPVGAMVAHLHAAGLFHRDLTARNVLLTRGDGGFRVHLIDCPRAEHGWGPPRRAFLRRADLFRLARSVLEAGATEDEVRTLLRASAFDEADDLLEMVGRSLRAGGARPMRTKLWVSLGV